VRLVVARKPDHAVLSHTGVTLPLLKPIPTPKRPSKPAGTGGLMTAKRKAKPIAKPPQPALPPPTSKEVKAVAIAKGRLKAFSAD
jgi:hypothetical protein